MATRLTANTVAHPVSRYARNHPLPQGESGDSVRAAPPLLRQPDRQTPKPAACFARRVKRASQKYLSFRKTEIMI